MRVTLAQLNPTIGAIDANAAAIESAIDEASRAGSDLVVTSELALLGYPPRDLVLREGVATRCEEALRRVAAKCTKVAALVGFAQPWPRGPRPVRNAVGLCRNGVVEAVYAKRLLPTYDVFDEDRFFTPGEDTLVFDCGGERVAALVCEDIWRSDDAGGARRYLVDPVEEALAKGATVLAIASASPFVAGKDARHAERLAALATKAHVISVNQAGGNDDLIFDGRSRAFAKGRGLVAQLGAFNARTHAIALDAKPIADAPMDRIDEIIAALVCGIRDYVKKTGNAKAIIGISGGIDSALVATLGAMALGATNVTGVLMPSRYSSQGSIDDALDLARRLGISHTLAPIQLVHAAMAAALAPDFGVPAPVVDENLQSRLRGTIVMAASNRTPGSIVLTTGNKSEFAAGYTTLYGDMNGGLAVIGDVLKTTVYGVARRINEQFNRYSFAAPPIPQASIEKPPSAELRPNQTDQDTLPPYEVLDAIVEGWIEREESIDSIARRTKIDGALVERWCRLIDRMQYKRDQAPVILKVSPRAFGRGRTMPIAHGV